MLNLSKHNKQIIEEGIQEVLVIIHKIKLIYSLRTRTFLLRTQ